MINANKNLKIAIFVGQFPVISETFVLNQIVGLLERGHEVDIFPVEDYRAKYTKEHLDFKKYNLKKRIYYFPKISRNYFITFIKLIYLIIKNGYKNPNKLFKLLNIFNCGEGNKIIENAFETLPLLDKDPYDIIHCQFGTVGLFFMKYSKNDLFKGKLVVSFRGADISRFVKERGGKVYNPLFEIGDLFLPNCDYFKERLINLGCNKDKIVVYRSGIDLRKFVFNPKKIDTQKKINIVTVGRLVEKKGIEYGIRAITKLIKEGYNIEFNIVGDGPLRSCLDDIVQELGIKNNVNFLGSKNHKEIIEILNKNSIFIATSVTASDGNQDAPVNTLKEAMAIGLPSIGTTHGGIPELIEDNVSGFLVPERDAETLAQKIKFLIDNTAILPKIIQEGRKRVEKDYDLNRLNDELVNLYISILNN